MHREKHIKGFEMKTAIEFSGSGFKVNGKMTKSNDTNLKHEILRVSSNRYHGEYREYFQVRFTSDSRILGLVVDTDVAPAQTAFCPYFTKLSDAIEYSMAIYGMLGANILRYRNRYAYREDIQIETGSVVVGNDDITISKSTFVKVNGEYATTIRDIVKPYLQAKLKGSGFVYTERNGMQGGINVKKDNYITMDFDEDENKVLFTIHTLFSEYTLEMDRVQVSEFEEIILHCEYVISSIMNAKLVKKVASDTTTY